MHKSAFLLLLFIPFYAMAQDVKLDFNKIETAIYKYNSMYSDVKNKADIVLYCTVDKTGNVQLQYQNEGTPEIYQYKLPGNVITNINTFFKDKKGLKTCQEVGMPEKGTQYGALRYNYVKIIDGHNKAESACYIEEFMTEDFNNLLLEITGIYAEKTPVPGAKKIITPAIISHVTLMHKRTGSLSKDGGPPPQEVIEN